MSRDDVGDAFRLAAAKTYERIRQDGGRLAARFAALFDCIAEHVFASDFGPDAAWRRSGVNRRVPPPLGMTLAAYLDELRIETAERMLALTAGRVATGRVAGTVGFVSYHTWQRAYRRVTGKKSESVRVSARLRPGFDDPTWHHVCRGTLPLDAARALLRCLRRLDSGEGVSPVTGGAASTPLPRPGEAIAGRCGGIADAEARKALRRAAVEPRRRLLGDAEGLPRDLKRVLRDVAEHLFDPDFSLEGCLERTEVRDTGITTKFGFFLGDTLFGLIERRRVETAVPLLADRRFTVKRIAEGVGWGFQSFTDAFRCRAGASAGEIRKTLTETVGNATYELWRRAGEGSLEPAEIRALDAFLRGLHPGALRPRAGETLAVRTDVDPRRVADVLELHRAVRDEAAAATLDEMLRTHPEYSAAHWYSRWIRDRLGRDSLTAAWAEWTTANRDLIELLGFPRDRRAERVEKEPRFQTDAFLWLLADSIMARLFHDAAESEHFADLAVAAAEARWLRDPGPESAGFRGLMIAFKGNALQRRNELQDASEKLEQALAIVRSHQVEPWIAGRIQSLHASILDRQGESIKARQSLFRAGVLMKEAGDELERLRCAVKRTSTWFAAAKDSTPLLTACIAILERRYPFETDLSQCAHVNRIFSRIYLCDGLTGIYLAEIRRFRAAMPPPSSSYAALNHQQVDGLLAALSGDSKAAIAKLLAAASWFEDHDLESHAAVCWLQYAWTVLDADSPAAERAAKTAYSCFQNSGFKSHALQQIALKIHEDASHQNLNRERLRVAILISVCPELEFRLPLNRSDP